MSHGTCSTAASDMKPFYTDATAVPLSSGRPLLILDADEVLLRFADGFDCFLRRRNLYLDFASYRLHGNVRRMDDKTAALDVEVTALLDEFRADLDDLEAVEDAIVVIEALKPVMDVVVLSNVSPAQAPARRRNLDSLGFAIPLIVNAGSKGKAVRALAQRAGRPVFFIDDIPLHHAAAAMEAPDVVRLHFVGDERLRPLMPDSPDAHVRVHTWREADLFIRKRLEH